MKLSLYECVSAEEEIEKSVQKLFEQTSKLMKVGAPLFHLYGKLHEWRTRPSWIVATVGGCVFAMFHLTLVLCLFHLSVLLYLGLQYLSVITESHFLDIDPRKQQHPSSSSSSSPEQDRDKDKERNAIKQAASQIVERSSRSGLRQQAIIDGLTSTTASIERLERYFVDIQSIFTWKDIQRTYRLVYAIGISLCGLLLLPIAQYVWLALTCGLLRSAPCFQTQRSPNESSSHRLG